MEKVKSKAEAPAIETPAIVNPEQAKTVGELTAWINANIPGDVPLPPSVRVLIKPVINQLRQNARTHQARQASKG